MSTTLDARLAALKDGEIIRYERHTGPVFSGIFVGIDDIGNVVVRAQDQYYGFTPDCIIFPPPPRAKPGKRYRNPKTYEWRVGLEDGSLWGPQYHTPVVIPFDPQAWIEVPDEQEGR